MIEARDGRYRVRVRWRGWPEVSATVGFSKRDAEAYERTLLDLRDANRRDVVAEIAAGRADLCDVHRRVREHGVSARTLTLGSIRHDTPDESRLGALCDEWMAWLTNPGTRSPRQKRPYSPQTVRRYKVSWDTVFAHVPGGRGAALSELTTAALVELRSARTRAGATDATINRDFVAVESFCRWLATNRVDLPFVRPDITKAVEPPHVDRHLEPDQLAMVLEAAGEDWRPLFRLLAFTGLRIGEAQGLERRDVNFKTAELHVVERPGRRLKSKTSTRDVTIPGAIEAELRALIAAPAGPHAPVFTGKRASYNDAYRAFERACLKAGLHDHGAGDQARRSTRRASGTTTRADMRPTLALRATHSLHSLRHTFGVACARAGLHPTAIQRLMGHSSITVTERYMRHAPSADQRRADAAAVAAQVLAPPAFPTPPHASTQGPTVTVAGTARPAPERRPGGKSLDP
jgi:integrase